MSQQPNLSCKSNRIISRKPLSYAFCRLVSAISHVHDLGYVHRDIKPDNILFDLSGHLKLIDMGLCKRLSFGDKALSIVGTFDYIAPEVLQREGYSNCFTINGQM